MPYLKSKGKCQPQNVPRVTEAESMVTKHFSSVGEARAVLVLQQSWSHGCSLVALLSSPHSSLIPAAQPRPCFPAGPTLASKANVMDTSLPKWPASKNPSWTKADSHPSSLNPSTFVSVSQTQSEIPPVFLFLNIIKPTFDLTPHTLALGL